MHDVDVRACWQKVLWELVNNVMAAFSEDGSEWSECGFDEELHRDLSSLREVLANDAG